MIDRLRGTVLSKQAPEVVIDVNGVGYEVRVPMTTLYQLPEVGAVVNGASELFIDVFGSAGEHARTAVGATSMPLGVAVEVEAVIEIAPATG